ncbi:hypothetical protein [Bacillus phage vB_BanS-Thrax1]|nr:hypothetical protein [Bacillus phage vB_BanS-Thrax1]
MNKFGCLEGYDVAITVGGVTYESDSVQTVDVETFQILHRISIQDSLIDVDLVNAIYSGEFVDKEVDIEAKGVMRGVDGRDYDSNLCVRNARLVVFNLPNTDDAISNPTLEFEVGIIDEYGSSNITLSVNDEVREA